MDQDPVLPQVLFVWGLGLFSLRSCFPGVGPRPASGSVCVCGSRPGSPSGSVGSVLGPGPALGSVCVSGPGSPSGSVSGVRAGSGPGLVWVWRI